MKLSKHEIKTIFRDLAKKFPVTWSLISKKRYILPQYRQSDYYEQDDLNLMSLDFFTTRYSQHFQGDTVNNAGFALIKSFQYDCPTFYLERELGELLLRTEIPVDFSSDDMRWRWPSMRIFLPKGLICVEREGKQRNMMYVDVGYTEGSEEIWPPQDCTDEMVRVFNRTTAVKFSDPRFVMLTFSTLDYSTIGLPSPFGRTVYGGGHPVEDIKLIDISSMWNTKGTTLSIDQEDDLLMGRLNQVVLNILLYLSHLPVENEFTEIRKPKRDGKRMSPGLYAARFIGSSDSFQADTSRAY
jgi:hypothetical protein